jgi:hypothetical protein
MSATWHTGFASLSHAHFEEETTHIQPDADLVRLAEAEGPQAKSAHWP